MLVSGPSNAASFALNADGSFTYTPAANFNGSDTFTYTAKDSSGAESGVATVTISITPVNDAPSFASGGNVTVAEDTGAYNAAWAASISKGAANESGQSVSFLVTNNNNALFSAQPALAPNGALTFTPNANLNGSATVTVRLQDNGGTANGGADTSPAVTFTITVTPVNDAPTVSLRIDPTAGVGTCPNLNAASATVALSVSDIDNPASTLTLSASSSNTAALPTANVVFSGSGTNRSVALTAVPTRTTRAPACSLCG